MAAVSSAFDFISSYMSINSPNNEGAAEVNGAASGDNAMGGRASDGGPSFLQRSVLDPCQHPVYIDPTDQPCSHFFQQKGAIDFKAYIRLKQEERLAVIQFRAAVKIQTLWRGFLIRANWKILVAAAIKIQSGIRGHLARKRFKEILKERDAKDRLKHMEAAAIKIQAAWRGYISRKNKLDFKKYKSIQEKNEALRRSIARINELESALLKSLQGGSSSDSRLGSADSQTSTTKTSETLDPCKELTKTDTRLSLFLNNFMTPSVEDFLVEKIPEYVNELSESRIAELYAYLANMESEMKQEQELEKLVAKLGGTHMLTDDQLGRLEESRRNQKERAQNILDLAKLVMMGPLKKKLDLDKQPKKEDSIDTMFPAVPERPDVIQPDPVKVEALKDAIRMFRQQGELKEDRDLKKKHVFLRTKACPGIYSDIYTTDLTEMEQKLKALRFWKGSLEAEAAERKEQLAKENRLKLLFAHALQLSNTRRGEEEEDDEEDEEETEAGDGLPMDLYSEYEGEMGPEDDEDDDDTEEEYGAGETFYGTPSDPKPPPPTPMPNTDDYYSSSGGAGNDDGDTSSRVS